MQLQEKMKFRFYLKIKFSSIIFPTLLAYNVLLNIIFRDSSPWKMAEKPRKHTYQHFLLLILDLAVNKRKSFTVVDLKHHWFSGNWAICHVGVFACNKVLFVTLCVQIFYSHPISLMFLEKRFQTKNNFQKCFYKLALYFSCTHNTFRICWDSSFFMQI